MIRASSSAFILSQEGELHSMFFMNYGGMETASGRVLKYAEDLKQVEGTMYQSTKDKVENSLDNLKKSVEIMEKFLEEHKDDNTRGGSGRSRRSMIDYEEMDKRYVTREEFNERMDQVDERLDNLDKKVDGIFDKLDQLLQKSVSVVSDAVDTVRCAVIPDPYDPKNATDASAKPYLNLPETATKSEKKKKDKSNRKLMRQNHELLSKVTEEVRQNCDYHELIECAELISYWFDQRFEPSRYPKGGFNADYIFRYAEQVIGAYAYHWVQGELQLKKFVEEFKTWCDDLSSRGKNNTYMYPFSVGKINYTKDWIESDVVASKDNYKWVTLATFLSEGLSFVSRSYNKFADMYIDNDHYDNLLDVFLDSVDPNRGAIANASSEGDVCNSDRKFSTLCKEYLSLESTIISDEDRYNMLDQPVCFA